jgi:pyruvate dehydrogenase E1 component alpha subunit
MTLTEPRIDLGREQLLWMYERMSLIREFEERLKLLVERGLPVGATHYYVGEEAVAVGVCAALQPTDWIASTHRGHGHCIAKGVDVGPMMAELFGKEGGTNLNHQNFGHAPVYAWDGVKSLEHINKKRA